MGFKKEGSRVPYITPRTSVSIRMEKYCAISNCHVTKLNVQEWVIRRSVNSEVMHISCNICS
jgi:hypothetical protein